ncbi:DUF4232 domain-containing protein [Streptomyces turgidiscabies]|uniref:Putative lipoprotein n=1 Tax=Streptomyces turgidiscabies (strain Car8) TaxID=698760 RepID=L7ES71_STRT8|nr:MULTISPECIES: DUF4232 domain-containing protein [Streptomyces]ELP62273.1 putative lipoprotein [Streptomyces turgidiscabies Car8]MDX3498734.1 DUF4232 domain-containing protein [Streptomyces turgidiscabies]GAQ74838.1 hypothetical protein T45_06618 [Streptomyces turgidiscabies]
MRRPPASLRPALVRTVPLLPALAATALLLAACGTETGRAGAADPPSRTQVDDPGKDGVRITSLTLPPPASSTPSPSPSDNYSVSADSLATDSGVSAGYEVTNNGSETLTYTVVFSFLSADGGAMGNQTVTVRDVGPGKTVRGTVRQGQVPPTTPRVTQAKVLEVTKVPTSEAPAESGTCPASGIRVSADEGDAAMGLRVVGLHLDNCGKGDYTVEGYPLLELLDDARKPVTGVKILDGSTEITTGAGPDNPPRPVTLEPGESATAALVWRNTTEFGTPVNVPYVRVRAKAGATPVTVTPNLDLGTTGKLGVRPWVKAEG